MSYPDLHTAKYSEMTICQKGWLDQVYPDWKEKNLASNKINAPLIKEHLMRFKIDIHVCCDHKLPLLAKQGNHETFFFIKITLLHKTNKIIFR